MTTEEMIYDYEVFEISRDLCDKAPESKQRVVIDYVIVGERIYGQLT